MALRHARHYTPATSRRRLSKRGLPPGGDGGHDGGMSDLEKRVGSLETKVDQMRVDLAEIKGRISQIPTTWQMATWFVGVSMGLVALVFTIARAMK